MVIGKDRVKETIRDLDVTQEAEWDCGLCVVRALLTIKHCPSDSIDAPRRSLWTIELVLLLCTYGAGEGVVFTTTYCGVNPNHKKCLEFYRDADDSPESNPKEEDIEQFFCTARDIGVVIRHRKVLDEELERVLIDATHMVVVLVDGTVLMGGEEGHFLGHYILLYDFDSDLGVFYAKNPNSPLLNDVIPKSVLHAARAAYGTDDDIVFVPL